MCLQARHSPSGSASPLPVEGGPDLGHGGTGHPGTPLAAGRSAHTSGIVFQSRTRLIPTLSGETIEALPAPGRRPSWPRGNRGYIRIPTARPEPQSPLCEGEGTGQLYGRAIGVPPRAHPHHPGSSCCPLPRPLLQGLPEGWGGHLRLLEPCVPPTGLRSYTISPIRELLELPWDQGQSQRGPVGSGRVASMVG